MLEAELWKQSRLFQWQAMAIPVEATPEYGTASLGCMA